jgi:ribosomal protein S27E
MCSAAESQFVLRVRFFVCEGCGTVHADPEKPPRCCACGRASLTELGGRDGAAAYFSPSRDAT